MERTKQMTLDEMPEDVEKPPEEEMTREERIDLIRERGTDAMKAGLDSILDGNKYKPKKERMWREQLKKGKRMVRTILEKKD